MPQHLNPDIPALLAALAAQQTAEPLALQLVQLWAARGWDLPAEARHFLQYLPAAHQHRAQQIVAILQACPPNRQLKSALAWQASIELSRELAFIGDDALGGPEALLRLVLAEIKQPTANETAAESKKRLLEISPFARERQARLEQFAAQRKEELQIALAMKEAQESADKWTRE